MHYVLIERNWFFVFNIQLYDEQAQLKENGTQQQVFASGVAGRPVDETSVRADMICPQAPRLSPPLSSLDASPFSYPLRQIWTQNCSEIRNFSLVEVDQSTSKVLNSYTRLVSQKRHSTISGLHCDVNWRIFWSDDCTTGREPVYNCFIALF